MKNWIENNWYIIKKESLIWIISISIGIMVMSAITATRAYSNHIQEGIAEKVVRFHVLANSDDPNDQAVKLAVRDAVLAYLEPYLGPSGSLEESLVVLETHLPQIETIAKETLRHLGQEEIVEVSIAQGLFPLKEYGDVVLPAGEYNSLRIVLGDGGGYNWWCVMYPPLCYVDVTHSELPEDVRQDMENIFTEEEYEIIITAKTSDNLTPKVKFKIVEWWQERQADDTLYATKR